MKTFASGTFAPSAPHSPVSRPLNLLFPLLLLLFLGGLLTPSALGDFSYSRNGGFITLHHYTGTGGVVRIPSVIDGLPVRVIGSPGFSGNTTLTSVTIPDSVTSIEAAVFAGCTALTSVTIGNSVTSLGDRAFYGCTGLTNVVIPNSVTSIGGEAFYNCTGLASVTIGNSVTSFGNGAFALCTGLTNVAIPDSVITIGTSAFSGCTGLTSITIGNSVTSIEVGAFYGCRGLTSVAIPNSVTLIGGQAFQGCTGLTSITIGNSVTNIENQVFSGCTSLTSVAIPDSVTFIGNQAFHGCTGLTNITIGYSVATIWIGAFSSCTNLTSVVIPSSLDTIGNEAFADCTGLASITFEGNAPAFFGANVFANTALSFTIYYHQGRSGFLTPEWNGYPTVMLGAPSSVPTLTEWREQHFGEGATNTGNAADDADPDGDGFTNEEEYTAGTDPKSAGSALQVETVTKLDATYTVTIEAQPNRRYELQRLVSAPGTTWQTVATQEPQAEVGSVSLTDSVAPTDAALYRVRVTLP